jgi:hypothetical protein
MSSGGDASEAVRMTLEEFRALPASERDLVIEEAVSGGHQLARWVTFTLEEFRALPASELDLDLAEAVYGGNQLARWVTFGFGDRPQINDFLAYVLATDGPLDDQKVADKIEAELQKVPNQRSEIELTATEIERLIDGVQTMHDLFGEDPALAHLLEEARGALARGDP